MVFVLNFSSEPSITCKRSQTMLALRLIKENLSRNSIESWEIEFNQWLEASPVINL
jgi:hypothetical protein